MDWDHLAAWWQREVADDPSYRHDVVPLLHRLLDGAEGPLLDLGCGEGTTTAEVAARVTAFGCDQSAGLLRVAASRVPVVRCVLPDLGWVRNGALGGAFAVYVLDLLADAVSFFAEAGRVVRGGGRLAVIVNHPVFTAPDSAPFLDQDGEVMWRWGGYLTPGSSVTRAGDTPVTMHHRPVAALLSTAADAGWILIRMEELGLGAETVAAEPGYAGQGTIPRFLGAAWRRDAT